ncbi:hypothetical protein BD779DRAFT_1469900 [Infundibulicybe gibba]|nr:hypothetical protein BD779DRAFT_1469900 [Infundibulicybe gibba]
MAFIRIAKIQHDVVDRAITTSALGILLPIPVHYPLAIHELQALCKIEDHEKIHVLVTWDQSGRCGHTIPGNWASPRSEAGVREKDIAVEGPPVLGPASSLLFNSNVGWVSYDSVTITETVLFSWFRIACAAAASLASVSGPARAALESIVRCRAVRP